MGCVVGMVVRVLVVVVIVVVVSTVVVVGGVVVHQDVRGGATLISRRKSPGPDAFS